MGTFLSTRATFWGSSSATSPPLGPDPVMTPHTLFLLCVRGMRRGAPAKPSQSDWSTTRTPVSRAASIATAASPSESALPIAPNPTNTGAGPLCTNFSSSSVGAHPAGAGGTQNPWRVIQRPQSCGFPRTRGEKPCITGKSWWWRTPRLRHPSSIRCTPTRFWCHSQTVLRRAIHCALRATLYDMALLHPKVPLPPPWGM
mmetsp:Transcript_17068/g.43006  ORF Transcript_17068/g.43006 Transcript_17068/m.43006 type:complete len:200 (-) Transcript_17068:566-1165(-)